MDDAYRRTSWKQISNSVRRALAMLRWLFGLLERRNPFIRWFVYQVVAFIVGIMPLWLLIWSSRTSGYWLGQRAQGRTPWDHLWNYIWLFPSILFFVFILPASWVWGKGPAIRLYELIQKKKLWSESLFRWLVYQIATCVLVVIFYRIILFIPWLVVWMSEYDSDPKKLDNAWRYIVRKYVDEDDWHVWLTWVLVFTVPAMWVWRNKVKQVGRMLNRAAVEDDSSGDPPSSD